MVDEASGAILEVIRWDSCLKAIAHQGVGGAPPVIRIDACISGADWDRVLLWARRELASGARVAWLLADELDALP